MTSTLLSLFAALSVAIVLGPLLGRAATQWFSGRGLTNALTELRGTFLPFLLAPALVQLLSIPPWLSVGLVVGFQQAISLSRWVGQTTGEWSRALVGGVALGRSVAALLSARSIARGAVVATLATSTIQVVVLEAVLSALALPGCVPTGSLGAGLESRSSSSPWTFAVLVALILATEALSTILLQRGVRPPGWRKLDASSRPEA